MSKKRELVLEHAERVFYENGYNAVGVKRIVNEADVSLMTLYNHFSTKEELVLTVLKRREERYFSLLKSSIRKKEGDPITQLAKAHIEWLNLYASNGCMFLRLKEELASDHDNPVVQFVNKHKQALVGVITDLGYDHNQALRLVLLLEGTTSLAEVFSKDRVTEQLYFLIEKMFE